MKKIIVLILLSLSFLTTCEKKEEPNIEEPNIEEPNIITGFEGNYISNEFIYPPLGIKTSLILKIGNGLADNDIKSIQMSLVQNHSILVRSIEIDSVEYIPESTDNYSTGRYTIPACIFIEFDFVDDPERGSIGQLEKYDYEGVPLARLTSMINVRKDNSGYWDMYTWAYRLYFYDLIEN